MARTVRAATDTRPGNLAHRDDPLHVARWEADGVRATISVGWVSILLAASLGACSSDDAAAAGSGETTHRALAAATFDAFPDETPVAAAPLAPRDGVPADSLGVEVAFDAERGDNVHVTVVVSPRVQMYDRSDCESDEPTDGGCVETETDDGDPLRLSWQELAFESDPGYVSVLVRRDDEVVGADLERWRRGT